MTERERLYELIVDADNEFFRETPYGTAQERIEKTVEHLIKNGVLLPPMKIGQIIYDIDGEDVRELKVLKIVYFCDSYSMGCLRVGSIEETTRRNITVFDIEIGKHVFFTREEAEAELEKRRKEVKNE
jgi:hypothetical protein